MTDRGDDRPSFLTNPLRADLFFRELKSQNWLAVAPPPLLYHYTSSDGLHGIMRDRAIWLTNAAYMNDEHELTYPVAVARDVIRHLLDAATEPEVRSFITLVAIGLDGHVGLKSWYIASFSTVGNSLSQWRAYCPAGGYSFALDGDRFTKTLQDMARYIYGPVVYNPTEQRTLIGNIFARHIGYWRELREKYSSLSQMEFNYEVASLLNIVLAQQFVFLKSPAFSEECEWRIVRYLMDEDDVSYRTRGGVLTPYVVGRLTSPEAALPLIEVTVSPLGDIGLSAHAARLLLRGPEYSNVKIRVPDYKLRF